MKQSHINYIVFGEYKNGNKVEYHATDNELLHLLNQMMNKHIRITGVFERENLKNFLNSGRIDRPTFVYNVIFYVANCLHL